ncbi:MAG: nuclear transport factor 2 family protein [Pseudomonadota bacterium]
MDTRQIGDMIADHMRTGRELQLLDLLYAPDAVSVERLDFGKGTEFHGIDAIRDKKLYMMQHFPLVGLTVHGPYLHGEDRFIMVYFANVNDSLTSQNEALSVAGHYTVAGGKIVREEFFM